MIFLRFNFALKRSIAFEWEYCVITTLLTYKPRELNSLIKRKTCFYTKVPFNNANENTRRTIDRLDCNLGYVKGNVVACTHEANQLKEHFFEHTGFDPEMPNYGYLIPLIVTFGVNVTF